MLITYTLAGVNCMLYTGFVQFLENLESPEKMPLVMKSSGNLFNSTKNMKCMEGNKKN